MLRQMNNTNDKPTALTNQTVRMKSLNSTPEMITSLKVALDESDAVMAQREAHSIKGSAATFRAESLHEIAVRIEQLAEEEDLAAENGTEALKMLSRGCTPVEVTDSTQMVNSRGEKSIDLAIIDITMPDMDGLELVQRIRSNTKIVHLPVLMCTASRRKDDIMRAARLGVKGFLVKPISRELLLAKVDKILKK